MDPSGTYNNDEPSLIIIGRHDDDAPPAQMMTASGFGTSSNDATTVDSTEKIQKPAVEDNQAKKKKKKMQNKDIENPGNKPWSGKQENAKIPKEGARRQVPGARQHAGLPKFKDQVQEAKGPLSAADRRKKDNANDQSNPPQNNTSLRKKPHYPNATAQQKYGLPAFKDQVADKEPTGTRPPGRAIQHRNIPAHQNADDGLFLPHFKDQVQSSARDNIRQHKDSDYPPDDNKKLNRQGRRHGPPNFKDQVHDRRHHAEPSSSDRPGISSPPPHAPHQQRAPPTTGGPNFKDQVSPGPAAASSEQDPVAPSPPEQQQQDEENGGGGAGSNNMDGQLLSARVVNDPSLVAAVPLDPIRRKWILFGVLGTILLGGVAVTGGVLGSRSTSDPVDADARPTGTAVEPTMAPTPAPTLAPTLSVVPSSVPTIAPVTWIELETLLSPNTTSNFGLSVAASDDAAIVFVGSEGDVSIHRRENNGGTWVRDRETLAPFGTSSSYGLGLSVSADGNVVAVANPDGPPYKLHVAYFTGTSWSPLGSSTFNLDIGPDYICDNNRGEVLAIARKNTNVIAIGTPDSDQVEILTIQRGSWQINATITLDDGGRFSDFGFAVALNAQGNILAVGARNAIETSAGSVNVYEWSSEASIWARRGQEIIGEAPDDRFGYAVVLSDSGDVLASNANFNDGGGVLAGHVRVFDWDSTDEAWIQRGEDIDGTTDDLEFGRVLAMNSDGRALAIASPFVDGGGRVKVYVWAGNQWIQRGDTILGSESFGALGSSLALSSDGNILIAGQPGQGSQGQVRIFEARS